MSRVCARTGAGGEIHRKYNVLMNDVGSTYDSQEYGTFPGITVADSLKLFIERSTFWFRRVSEFVVKVFGSIFELIYVAYSDACILYP